MTMSAVASATSVSQHVEEGSTISSGSSKEGSAISSGSSMEKKVSPLACTDPAEYLQRLGALYGAAGPVILGNILEWYDWTVFGFLEDDLAEVFMDGQHTATWLVFAVPFVVRPLGSILLGWVGDHHGRTVALNLAIWGMAASTVLQGCLIPKMPGVRWVLIGLRVLSGLSAGGEAAGVNTYMTESGGLDREQTLVAAVGVNNVSGALAFFLSNAVALALRQLPREAQLSWGWRVPFLLALPLGIASVVLRRRMQETEAFKQMQKNLGAKASEAAVQEEGSAASSREVAEVDAESFLAFVRATVLSIVVIAGINSCNYFPVYLATWMQKACGFSATMGLALSATAKIVQVITTVPVSFVGDRIGASKTMMIGGTISALTLLPALVLVLAVSHAQGDRAEGPTALTVTIAFLVLGVALQIPVGFYNIPCPLYLTSLFPTEFRGRGAGIGLGVASMAGGFTPAVCSALARHRDWFPGLFVTLLVVPSLAALAWSRRAASLGKLSIHQRSWLF